MLLSFPFFKWENWEVTRKSNLHNSFQQIHNRAAIKVVMFSTRQHFLSLKWFIIVLVSCLFLSLHLSLFPEKVLCLLNCGRESNLLLKTIGFRIKETWMALESMTSPSFNVSTQRMVKGLSNLYAWRTEYDA